MDNETTGAGTSAELGGRIDAFVITRQELNNLERVRLLIHEVAGRMEGENLSKHQLFDATSTLWSVVNLKRDKAL